MHDVEARPGRAGELEHEGEVGVVLGHLDVRRRVHVVTARVLGQGDDVELDDAELGVGAGSCEDRDLVAATGQLACEVPRHRLEAPGEGLGDREAAVGDHADTEPVPLLVTVSVAHGEGRHLLSSR